MVFKNMERAMGIEPTSQPWQGFVNIMLLFFAVCCSLGKHLKSPWIL